MQDNTKKDYDGIDYGFEDPYSIINRQQITLEDIKEHIVGPFLSLAFHIIIFVLLFYFMIGPTPRKQKEQTEVDVINIIPKKLDPMIEPPVTEQVQIDQPTTDYSSPSPSTTPSPEISQADLNESQMSTEDPVIDIEPILSLAENDSAAVIHLPQEYSKRGGANKLKSLEEGRAVRGTLTAINKSLKWLAEHQNEDGSWGDSASMRPVFTALATLAFLGNDVTPMSQQYGPVVLKAIKKLVAYGDEAVLKRHNYIPGPTYTHPIIVYALAETYSLTKMSRVKKVLDILIEPMINNINKDGYYYYGYDNKIRKKFSAAYDRSPITGRYPLEKPPVEEYVLSDLTFSVWNYQALKAAYVADVRSEETYATIQKAIKGLKKANIGKEKSDFTLTCLGAFCLGILGEDGSKEAKRCYKYIENFNKKMLKTCDWKGDKDLRQVYPNSFNWAIYTWYYQTMVLFQMTKGGDNRIWSKWSRAFGGAFVKEQENDGSFSSPAQKYGSSMKPGAAAEWTNVIQFKKPLDLALYCTTFSCLTLEVYFRYLPTYDRLKPKDKKPSKGFNDSSFDELTMSEKNEKSHKISI